MQRETENTLVRNCQRGDRQAMEALVREYERPVFNAAFRMLGNRNDAADVTQNTFLKAFQNIDQFNPAFKFFSWVYRIAMNESINYLKRRPATAVLPENITSNEPDPEGLVGADQVSERLAAVLATLTDEYRSVIVLKYFSDLSYQEMATVLRIPEKTVKSRLYSARRRMKEALERQGVTLS